MTGTKVADPRFKIAQVGKDRFNLGKKNTGFLGWLQTPVAPLEQTKAQLLFELFNGERNSGLLDTKVFSRMHCCLMGDDGAKYFKEPERQVILAGNFHPVAVTSVPNAIATAACVGSMTGIPISLSSFVR